MHFCGLAFGVEMTQAEWNKILTAIMEAKRKQAQAEKERREQANKK